MIGHMIFKKNLDSEDKLGLKIIGGQVLSNGRIGAIIEKVKQGSIADTEGHLKPGTLKVIDFYAKRKNLDQFYDLIHFHFLSVNISR